MDETVIVSGGIYPEGMAYAPDVHKLHVSDERGGTDTVTDANTNTRIGPPVHSMQIVRIRTVEALFHRGSL